MKKAQVLLLALIFLLGLIGCQESKVADAVQIQTAETASKDNWTLIDQFEWDVDGDHKTDAIQVYQVKGDLDTVFKLRVTYNAYTFEKAYPGMGVAPEVIQLDSGASGHSLLIILNGSESKNISQVEHFYENQYGAIFFDFSEAGILPHHVDFEYMTADGKEGIALSIEGQELTVKDYITGMGCTVTLELTEEQKERLAVIDTVEYYRGFSHWLYDSIKVSEDRKQVIFEKMIPGVMHNDLFATILMIYTYTDGRWQCLEEQFISERPASKLIHQIAPKSETIVD